MDADSRFSVEGQMQIGPSEYFFVFLDGEWLGKQLVEHFALPQERGYTDMGRVRVTIERLEEPAG
jgi:hypothetical protein